MGRSVNHWTYQCLVLTDGINSHAIASQDNGTFKWCWGRNISGKLAPYHGHWCLAPSVAKSSAATVLIMLNKRVLVLHKKGFHVVPASCQRRKKYTRQIWFIFEKILGNEFIPCTHDVYHTFKCSRNLKSLSYHHKPTNHHTHTALDEYNACHPHFLSAHM